MEKKKAEKHICIVCGKTFETKIKQQIYCSDECAEVIYSKNRKVRYYEEQKKLQEAKHEAKKVKPHFETVAKDCKHKKCKYRGRVSGYESCEYILQEGHSRGCEISQCDKWK